MRLTFRVCRTLEELGVKAKTHLADHSGIRNQRSQRRRNPTAANGVSRRRIVGHNKRLKVVLGVYPTRHSGVVSHLERDLVDPGILEGVGALGDAVLGTDRFSDGRTGRQVVELPDRRVLLPGNVPEGAGESDCRVDFERRATRGRDDVMPNVDLDGLGCRVTSRVRTGYGNCVDATDAASGAFGTQPDVVQPVMISVSTRWFISRGTRSVPKKPFTASLSVNAPSGPAR